MTVESGKVVINCRLSIEAGQYVTEHTGSQYLGSAVETLLSFAMDFGIDGIQTGLDSSPSKLKDVPNNNRNLDDLRVNRLFDEAYDVDEVFTVQDDFELYDGTIVISEVEVLENIELDSRINMRIANSVDQKYIDEIANLRKKLSSDIITDHFEGSIYKSGTCAYADVNINGAKPSYYATSRIDFMNDLVKNELPELSVRPKKASYLYKGAKGKNGQAYSRKSCVEYKILNDIASDLEPGASGKITIFIELEPCDSCKNIFNKFIEDYPNVQIEIIHNDGNRVKVKKLK